MKNPHRDLLTKLQLSYPCQSRLVSCAYILDARGSQGRMSQRLRPTHLPTVTPNPRPSFFPHLRRLDHTISHFFWRLHLGLFRCRCCLISTFHAQGL